MQRPGYVGCFTKAVVMAVLLYGSGTWNLTPSAMERLEGFHIRSAYGMARRHKPRRNSRTGKWTYPKLVDVLEEVGLFSISHYVQVRRQTIAKYIVDRPILSFFAWKGRDDVVPAPTASFGGSSRWTGTWRGPLQGRM